MITILSRISLLKPVLASSRCRWMWRTIAYHLHKADVGIPSHVVLPVFERDRAGDYVVAVDGHPTGPYTVTRLNEMMREGIITAESYVWRSGMSDWLRIKDCPDIIK